MLNIKSLANNVLLLGALGLIVSVLFWHANKPAAPTAYDRNMSRGSLLNSFAVNARDREIEAYPKCLYQPSDYTITCPAGGNLYLLTWASAALMLLGLVLRSSVKND